MPAPKGNKFWQARSRHGRLPKFSSPEMLWEACEDYFQWVTDNPLWEEKQFAFQGVVTVHNAPKMRAMTISGLCIFIDIDHSTWASFRGHEDFSAIVTRVEHIIRNQKFEGAAAELLNSNIIARDLGLRDNIANEHSAPGGGPIKSESKVTYEFVNADPETEVK